MMDKITEMKTIANNYTEAQKILSTGGGRRWQNTICNIITDGLV